MFPINLNKSSSTNTTAETLLIASVNSTYRDMRSTFTTTFSNIAGKIREDEERAKTYQNKKNKKYIPSKKEQKAKVSPLIKKMMSGIK